MLIASDRGRQERRARRLAVITLFLDDLRPWFLIGLLVLLIGVPTGILIARRASGLSTPGNFPPGWRCTYYGKGAYVCDPPQPRVPHD